MAVLPKLPAVLLTAALPLQIFAATATWTGSADGSWSGATNWTGSGTLPPVDGDAIIIDDAAANALTLDDGSHSAGLFTFGTTGTRITPFTVNTGANTLTFTGGLNAGGAFTAGSSALTFSNSNIRIAADQNWNVAGTPGSVTSDAGVAINAPSAGFSTLVLDAALTKIGAGQLQLVGTTVSGSGNLVVSAGALKFNAGSSKLLTIGGSGNVTVNNGASLFISRNSGTISLTRALVMNDGSTLVLGGGGSTNSTTIDSAVTWSGAATLNVQNTGNAFVFSGAWSGAGTVTKSGVGAVTLAGDLTGFTGGLAISAGTLAVSGGDNRFSSSTAVTFSGSGTLDVGATTQTLSALTVGNTFTGTVTGVGGTLRIVNGNFSIGGTTGSNAATLNMGGLDTFVYNNAAGNFSVGGNLNTTSANASGTVTLAKSSSITAANFFIGREFSLSHTVDSTLSGTVNLNQANSLHADTIGVAGTSKTTGTLQFLGSLTGATVEIRGTAGGSSQAVMNVGAVSNSSLKSSNGTADFTGGSLDALISTLRIGQTTGGSQGATGVFRMGAGQLIATTVNLGERTGTGNGVATGTFQISGGLARIGTLALVPNSGTGTGTNVATVNLNGGTLAAQNIQAGSGAGTRNFNWNDGTLANYDASTDLTVASGISITLSSAGTHTFSVDSGRSATLNGLLTGTGGTLLKTGAGRLLLNGANTHTGATTVSAGILGGTGSITASAVTVQSGARLQGGVGAASGALTLGGDMTLASGSILSLALGAGGAHSSIVRTGGVWTFATNQAFTFLDAGATTGTYSGLITGLTGTETGLASIAGWTNTNGWTGNFVLNGTSIDFVLTSVPEPSDYGLLGAGALASAALVRRRRKSAVRN